MQQVALVSIIVVNALSLLGAYRIVSSLYAESLPVLSYALFLVMVVLSFAQIKVLRAKSVEKFVLCQIGFFQALILNAILCLVYVS